MKRQVINVSAVGIIFRAKDPAQLFIEMKDDGHPIRLVRRQLCPIGGNWIGDSAKQDGSPRETFCREFGEELSFDRPVRSSAELALLQMAKEEIFAPTPAPNVKPGREDEEALNHLKDVIVATAVPFGDYINTVPTAALNAADPNNTREGWAGLASYWLVPLEEDDWQLLVSLQKKFGNLSNEALTLVTSLDEILASNQKTAFAHDRVLQRFFLAHGLEAARDLPMVLGLESMPIGAPLPTYEAYLEEYDIMRRPS